MLLVSVCDEGGVGVAVAAVPINWGSKLMSNSKWCSLLLLTVVTLALSMISLSSLMNDSAMTHSEKLSVDLLRSMFSECLWFEMNSC